MPASWDKWKPLARRDKMGMLAIGIILILWDIIAIITIPYHWLPGSNNAVGIFFGLAGPAVFGIMALYFALRSPMEKSAPSAKSRPVKR